MTPDQFFAEWAQMQLAYAGMPPGPDREALADNLAAMEDFFQRMRS